MNKEFIGALEDLEREKGIKKETLLDAIEMALISAYKKHFGQEENARVEINQTTGEIRVFAEKTVVADPSAHDPEEGAVISLEEAREKQPTIEIGDVFEEEIIPKNFGRIAAQTAKQVVVQRIREAERGIIYDRYSEKESQVMMATIHRVDRGSIYIEVGRAEGIIPVGETVPGERYPINERLQVYILEVRKTNKGPQIVASRTHPALVKKLFEREVPEIKEGIVQIKSIAREPGARTKIAVSSQEREVDPVGACVGPRGTRIEKVVEELGGEKIDVIPWSSDPIEFIANALRPAKVLMVQINEDEKAAKVIVPDYQLSLAIGKEGQNARLAAKLTGWKIDIKSKSQSEQETFGEDFANAAPKDLSDPFGSDLMGPDPFAPAAASEPDESFSNVPDPFDRSGEEDDLGVFAEDLTNPFADDFALIDELNDEEALEDIEEDILLDDEELDSF